MLSLPADLGRDGDYLGAGRVAGVHSAQHLDDVRAVFPFRSKQELDYHYTESGPDRTTRRSRSWSPS